MKAWEICKKENVGKVYKDSEGDKWVVTESKNVYDENDLLYDLYDLDDLDGYPIGFTISELAKMDFEEVVDWSKVPVDTKILVADYDSEGEAIEWKKRHFAKYENGIVYAWDDGKTSFTAKLDGSCMNWDCAKLYKEGDE